MKSNKRFYETLYRDSREDVKPSGFLGWFFQMLRDFELHRIPATLNLLERGKRLLDIGCGNGNLLIVAKRGGKYERVWGVDIANIVLKRAKRNVLKEMNKLRGFIFERVDVDNGLPYKDGFFDAVTCIAVLEHIFDPCFAVQEMHRVLKKGGVLILEVPNLAWLPRRFSILFGQLPKTGNEEGWDSAHLHYFTFMATEKLLKDYGFKIEYKGSTGIFSKIRNIWPSLLGGNIIIKARKK